METPEYVIEEVNKIIKAINEVDKMYNKLFMDLHKCNCLASEYTFKLLNNKYDELSDIFVQRHKNITQKK